MSQQARRYRTSLSKPIAVMLSLLLAITTLVFVQPSAANAAVIKPIGSTYDNVVNGDYVMIGNGNLVATGNALSGSGTPTQLHNGADASYNDYFTMSYTGASAAMGDNSSSARVTIPAGATVAHAELYWMGNTGAVQGSAGVRCGANTFGASVAPAGSFTDRIPRVRIGSGAVEHVTGATTTTEGGPLADGQAYYYTARANVTSLMAGLASGSQQTITVGNLWIPQGPGCFGGWSMSIVYDFGGYVAGNALSEARNVILADGHARLAAADADLTVPFGQFQSVASGTRASFTIGEGDAAITGDYARYRPTNSGPYTTIGGVKGNNNIGTSHASSSVRYQGTGSADFYNASMTVVDVPLTQVGIGNVAPELLLGTSGDSYVLQAVALSVPVGAVQIDKSFDGTADVQQVVEGQSPSFTITVRNTGSAPLSGIVVQDPLAPACARTIPDLAPAGEFTYTCEGPATPSGYTNVATVSAQAGSTSVRDHSDESVVEYSHIALDKTVAPGPVYTGRAGDTLNYTFVVRNSGTSTLTGITVDDEMTGLEGLAIDWSTSSNSLTGPDTLAGGETVLARATYTLTQADVNAGEVVNDSASTTGTDARGNVVEAGADARHPIASVPALQLQKRGDLTDGMPGDIVTYTFTARNIGNVTLEGVSIDDPLEGLSELTYRWPGTPGVLQPGQAVTATATAALTQAQVDAGRVDNTATVVGTPPTGPEISTEGSTRVDVLPTPGIQIEKRGVLNGEGVEGDEVEYELVVVNEGNVTLTDVTVTDPLFEASDIQPIGTWPSGTEGTLLSGQSMTFVATHVLTQDEVDSGRLDNTAHVSGTPPSGPAVEDTDSFTVPVEAQPGIELVKSGVLVLNGPGVADDVVEYTFEVVNNGNVTLTDVVIDDPRFDAAEITVDWPGESGQLAPGETATARAVWSVVQSEQDAGRVVNTASVTGTPPTGSPVTDEDTEVVPIVLLPSLALEKAGSLGEGPHFVGDTIDYTFTVTNTGNVTITGISVDDPLVGGAVAMSPASLAPGDSATGNASYTLTQADIDRGYVDNSATATGTPPPGEPPTTDTTTERTPVPQTSSLTLDKSGELAEGAAGVAGDTVEYTFTVRNDGNTTLTGVTVTDPIPGLTTPTATAWPDIEGQLLPGESVIFTATYELTQRDVDAEAVDNTALAIGTTPDEAQVNDPASETVPIDVDPSIVLTKSGALAEGALAGDLIEYEFEMLNDGPLTLHNVAIVDVLEGLSAITYGWPNPEAIGTIPPGERATATATYELTQADVDRGYVDNAATVLGVTEQNEPVTDGDEERVELPAEPGIELTKSPVLMGDGVAGNTITYTLTAENTGNVTLTGVTLADPLEGLSALSYTWPGEDGVLLPGEIVTATATYSVSQGDVDRGSVENTATASGTGVRGGDVSDTADGDVELSQDASIEIVKDAALADGATGAVGDTVEFDFLVRNTGDVTLTSIGIDDPMFPEGVVFGDWPGETGVLLPGGEVTATASIALTQAHLDVNGVVNTATVTGTPPNGDPIDDEDGATVPIEGTASIALDKEGALSGTGAAGDTIAYTFTITNDGTVTVRGVELVDELPGLSEPQIDWSTAAVEGQLAPGESVEATASYTLTQADADTGVVDNEASVSGTTDSNGDVSDSDDHEQPLTSTSDITIAKSHTAGDYVVGDAIEYTFEVTNSGDLTLRDVSIADELEGLSDIVYGDWPGDTGVLLPGESVEATATIVVTQAHVDAGEIVNQATATGTPPRGDVPEHTDGDRVPLLQDPVITLDKSGVLDGRGIAGDEITYTFTIRNGGNVTIDDITLVDDLNGLDDIEFGLWPSTPGTLAPGQVVQATATYTLTQADADAGQVVNEARVTGATSTAGPVGDDDGHTEPLGATPAIEIVKSHVDGEFVVGDVVTYEFEITNTGDQTLSAVSASDELPGLSELSYADWPTAVDGVLPPDESVTATATLTVTQAHVDAGRIDNTAVAAGTSPLGVDVSDDADDVVPFETIAVLTLDKVGELQGVGAAGDTVDYTFTITNDGAVTIRDIVLTDPLEGISTPVIDWSTAAVEGQLAPLESVVATATYTLTQADADLGEVLNEATVIGTTQANGDVEDTDDHTQPLPSTSQIEIEKSHTDSGFVLGDTVQFDFLVTNTGDLTLRDVTVVDALPGLSEIAYVWPDEANPGTLLPGESVTASATVVVTQLHVDAGEIVNEATATGTPPRGETPEDSDGDRVPLPQNPVLTLIKDGALVGDAVGVTDDEIRYTFTIRNDGDVTIRGIELTDDLNGLDDVVFDEWPGGVEGELAPGEQVTATATYTVTLADADEGEVVNRATAEGTTDTAGPVEDEDGHTETLAAAPAIQVVKSHPEGTYAVDDIVEYTFVVTNTGDVTLRDVQATDALEGLSDLVYGEWPGEEGVLLPTESVTATATLTVTQAHVDAGSIVNTATVTGTPPRGDDPIEDTTTDVVPFTQLPSISLAKSSVVEGANAGDTVTYELVAANTGNVTLENVAFADELEGLSDIAYGDWPGEAGVLAPGERITATATYVLTQDDVDSGSIANDATVVGTPPSGDEVGDDASVTDPLPATPSMRIAKVAQFDAAAVDEVVTYDFELENTGNVTLTGVAIADPMVGLSELEYTWPGAEGVLAPGATVTATANYTITQADVDAGGVWNTATGNGVPPVGEPERPTTDEFVPIAQHPSIALDKSSEVAADAVGAAGEQVTYTFVVTNTGDVTLTEIAVLDDFEGLSEIEFGTWPGTAGQLAPQQQVMATATYTLTQADIDAGFIGNSATATGVPPLTEDPIEGGDTDRRDVPGTLAISIDKSAVASNGADSIAGDTVSYEFVIANEGTRTLTSIVLSDPLEGLSEPVIDWSTATTAGQLLPGEQVAATASYTLTQPDVDAGLVENTATLAAEDLRGNPVTEDDDATVAFEGTPLLELDKSTTSEATAVGQVLDYRFEISNAGTVTMRDIALVDELEGVSAPVIDWSTAAVEGELAPGESVVATASLTVTQAHLDAGSIENRATVTGTPEGGDPIDTPDDHTYPLPQLPRITTSKAATLPEGSSGAVGDDLEYTIVVSNDGNVTLTDVTVDDPMFETEELTYDWSAAAAEGTLAPGETVTVTATRTLTQADVDAGRVDNTAVGHGTSPIGPLEDDSTTTITIVQAPAMSLSKSASTDAMPALGETVTYTFEAVNTGNVTLTGVTISDSLPGLSELEHDWSEAATEGQLAPGEVLTATATYVITQADVDAGAIVNAATATGTPPGDGDPVVPGDTVTIDVPQSPAIALSKLGTLAAGAAGVAGDTVEYAFEVVNTGNTTLTGVALSDPMAGLSEIVFGTWPGEPGVLLPGESVLASASYVLTQADVDAGTVENQATASATPPQGGPVTDGDTATVGTERTGAIDVEKSATVQGDGLVGDEIVYEFSATNTGSVTLTGVTLDDSLEGLGAIAYTWPGDAGVLAPGETVTATASYTLTQADIDRGEVVNAVVASGDVPDGAEPVEDGDTVTTPTLGYASLVLEKTGSLDNKATALPGDVITYTLVAANDGTVTLTGVTIDDQLEGLSELEYAWPGEVGVLLPGESVTATATYALTQADIDAGGVHNAATASAVPPQGYDTMPPVPAESETPLTQHSELLFEKTAPATAGGVGDTIEYGFRLENAGTTTLTDVALIDTMAGLGELVYAWPDAERPGVLLPGEVATATAAYTLTQADVDAGAVHNTASATGTPPGSGEPGEPTPAPLTPTDETTSTIERSAGITLSKVGAVEEGAIGEVGDRITFTFEVENTGNVTLTGVEIADAMPGLSEITATWPDPAAPGTLLPGETATATATYELTAADLERDTIVNEATVTGVPPDGVEPPSDDAAATVELPTPENPGTGLPQTGTEVPMPLIVGGGLLLLLMGLGLVLWQRRRSAMADA